MKNETEWNCFPKIFNNLKVIAISRCFLKLNCFHFKIGLFYLKNSTFLH